MCSTCIWSIIIVLANSQSFMLRRALLSGGLYTLIDQPLNTRRDGGQQESRFPAPPSILSASTQLCGALLLC
ncbi:hypothetical protein QBC45DRAFT_413737 [Copromyces sp. CBS 386.78]|nr:hypothetical protein QBC45DRAFT_413737 [Copromyces sp. CBS 386.78]